MAANYIVRTRDVDGSSTNRYASLAGAIKRFIEMAGGTIDGHIAEAHHELADRGERLPKIEELRHLRAVSMFGTVVIFEAVSEQAIAAAAAAREAAKAAEAAKREQYRGQVFDRRGNAVQVSVPADESWEDIPF